MKEAKNWMEKFSDGQNYQLYGVADNYVQCIDRDQVVDEQGKAYYRGYELVDIRTGERELVSAHDMEEFAETW